MLKTKNLQAHFEILNLLVGNCKLAGILMQPLWIAHFCMLGDRLYDLINSLTRGEKTSVRYYLAAKRRIMFEEHLEMEQYDHDRIKALFPDLSTSALATAKRKLLEQILEILYTRTSNNAMRDLQVQIGAVEVLFRKGKYEFALERVNEAIESAAGLEAVQDLFAALQLKRRILETTALKDAFASRDSALVELCLRCMDELSRVETLFFEATRIRPRQPHEREELANQQLQKMALLTLPELGRNRIRFHRAEFVLHRILGEHDACLEDCQKVLKIMADQPVLMGDPRIRDDFFVNQHFVVVYYVDLGIPADVKPHLSRYELMAKRWNGGLMADPVIYGRFMFTSVLMLVRSGNWDEAKRISRNLVNEVLKTTDQETFLNKPRWMWIVLYALFVSEDYKSVRRLAMEPLVSD
jgi:tetratricopeptide (TPR) repeat protein